MVFYVYILRIKRQNESSKYLTIMTENLTKRLKIFLNCKKNCNYIEDISLKYCESYKTRKEAIRRKKYIRGLSARHKKDLIQLNAIKIKELEHIFGENYVN